MPRGPHRTARRGSARPGPRRRAGRRVGVLASPAAPVFAALVAVFLLAWLVVSLRGGTFLTVPNVVNMLQRSVALGIVSAGQTVVILLGSLDLSVAQLISLSSLIGATTMDGWTPTSCRRSPRARGGRGRRPRQRPDHHEAAGQRVHRHARHGAGDQGPDRLPLGRAGRLRPGSFESFGYTRFGVLPLRSSCSRRGRRDLPDVQSPVGHPLYAVGGDEEVSKLSGLRTHRTIIAAHVVCSLAAAITGLFLASRLGSGTPTVGPDGGYDLESIAAVVLGGTALMGGRGGVLGTLGGVFILAVLDNTFNQLEVNSFLKDVVRGIIIIAAVAVYARRGEQSG